MSENDGNDKENNGVNEGKDAEGKEKEQENNEVKEEKAEVEEKGLLELYKKKATEGEKKDQETEKRSAASFKEDSDVVLREDLKVIFEKFGDVKVNLFCSSAVGTLLLLYDIFLQLFIYCL